MPSGRFAPSPTGPLHLGSLRTALLAWLFARSSASRFLVRMEDLDTGRVRPGVATRQLDDLAALGLDWDGPVEFQSRRTERYAAALERLQRDGRIYECYCTRAEIREAASAPHGPRPEGAYPGTCRDLTAAERTRRAAAGRSAALRFDARGEVVEVPDRLLGPIRAEVDDFVVRRNDGAFAYALAVVVDDAAQEVEEVVRGADLADSAPRQVLLARTLGLPRPAYAHVPLVLGPDGSRLAKRHGAVTLADLDAPPGAILAVLAASAGLAEPREAVSPGELVERFDPGHLRMPPATWDPQADDPLAMLASSGRDDG
jgi:glutamyl-tRNA synthetase